MLAKLESHDLQLQQLRAENGELRKSFQGRGAAQLHKVEEGLRTVKAEAASLVRADRRRKLPNTFHESEWKAREDAERAEREAARGGKWQMRFDALEQTDAALAVGLKEERAVAKTELKAELEKAAEQVAARGSELRTEFRAASAGQAKGHVRLKATPAALR